MYFCYFIIISPWEKTWYFIWTNLNLLHSKLLCAKFGWNWLSGSGKVDKNVKSLCMDGWTEWTDNRLSENFTWSSSSGDRAKNQKKKKKEHTCRNHFHFKTLKMAKILLIRKKHYFINYCKCIIFSVYDIWRFSDFLLFCVDLIWWLIYIHLF